MQSCSANARAAIATGSRAFCDSSANKVQWQPINNGYAVTQFYHGTVYPDGKSYFAGSQDNGTARGSDAEGPNNWKMIFSADGGYSAIDFNNPSTLYASTQGGNFRKVDGGWAGHSTSHLAADGKTPAGANQSFMDGHVEWRSWKQMGGVGTATKGVKPLQTGEPNFWFEAKQL